MKKSVSILSITALCLGLTGCSAGTGIGGGLLIVLGIALAGLAVVRSRTLAELRRTRRMNKKQRQWLRNQTMMTNVLYIIAAVLLIIGIVLGLSSCGGEEGGFKPPKQTEAPTDAPTEAPTDPPGLDAHAVADSDPANWQVGWEVFKDTMAVPSYERADKIFFGEPEDYFALPGIATFRGNNYRNSASYGTAKVESEQLRTIWTSSTGALNNWTGSGWTGQPLIVQWDDDTKAVMNLYESKKAKAGLVEVIYATLDGHIYFLDLDDGSYTRDPIKVGMAFKGAGALDPRGWPLMYVGSGDSVGDKQPRMFIISLIDGSILFEYGHADAQSLRTDNENWCAFDSSPLVHAETDTLIWPGESGILYTIKLNTAYDKAAGTISVAPGDIVKTRYTTSRSSADTYWYGYEPSCSIVDNYLYVAENGGLFYCVDLNTMKLIWAQDTKDDNNSSPVFERVSETEGYVYTAPSLHWTQDRNAKGSISIYKLNASTGEIVWEYPINCHTVSGVSGGVQSTPLLGKTGTGLEGLILYTVSRTPNVDSGVLIALDTYTGEKVWELSMHNYAWSSPVAVYEADGTAYVVVCDSAGYAMLIDGATGSLRYTISLGGLVEASPAVYNNTLVVGTRSKKIVAVEIS